MVTGNKFERVRWTIQREFVGAAVKICTRSKRKTNFGYRKRARSRGTLNFNSLIVLFMLHLE